MIFWDTSAILPLVVDEPASSATRQLLRSDPAMIVWWGTPVECWSAVARRVREQTLSAADAAAVRRTLGALGEAWTEVLASEEVRSHAGRLLLRHPLTAADALQLGAAMTWATGRPSSHPLATLDERLATAAAGEGFSLSLAPPASRPL